MHDITASGYVQRPAVLRDPANSVDDEVERGEYYLEEFGKLSLSYSPEKLEVFAGLHGSTYVLMSVKSDLVIFIITTVVKKVQRRACGIAVPNLNTLPASNQKKFKGKDSTSKD